jgi:ribonuclease BN (tRNA processing enzyme)
MKLKFVGVGSAFTTMDKGQSSIMLTNSDGKHLIVDCGMTFPYIFRDEMRHSHKDIEAVYISHNHADHIGGLEWLAYMRYFDPVIVDRKKVRPILFAHREVLAELWPHALSAGLGRLNGPTTLETFFDVRPVDEVGVSWNILHLQAVQTYHVDEMPSFGLYITNRETDKTCFITTDSLIDIEWLEFQQPYRADIIFHDCETLPTPSGVHAHYSDLKKLALVVKEKMYLYHYQVTPVACEADGFAGYVSKGQEFDI